MKTWIDHDKLVRNAKKFVRQYGYFFNQNAKRISSLVEVATYNSIVTFYQKNGYKLEAKNLGPKKSFKYKLQSTGLIENFSYFVVSKEKESLCIMHNTQIQSAHDKHTYFTADVSVAEEKGAITKKLKSGRKHSYISNKSIISFVEVKHLNPFPEVLFSFQGLVLEFLPSFIKKEVEVDYDATHLTPMLVFTGYGSEHSERIKKSLEGRYKTNIVFGTEKSDGNVIDFDLLLKYERPNKSVELTSEAPPHQ